MLFNKKENDMSEPIRPEDYAEPRYPLCDPKYGEEGMIRPVPQQRIIEKMNEYMSRRDYAGAERHLLYWLEEAKIGRDEGGELLIRNELIGHYRKTGDREKALANCERAIELLDRLDLYGSTTCGTTCVNAGTAMNAFGENERAMELFTKAKKTYESRRDTSPELLGGLYNNMALTCVALRRFEEAFLYYRKALLQMEQVPGGELEQAITCLNMADAAAAEKGPEEGEGQIGTYLDLAAKLLQTENAPRDGYYAFVCEKCAPAFEYYGYFLDAERLKKEAEEIYERNGARTGVL